MTNLSPKDKAKELVDKYYEYSQDIGQSKYSSKKCALICCNEIIAEIEPDELFQNYNERVTFWKDVKSEIELL